MLLGLQPSHLPEFRMRFSVANVPSRVPKNEPSSEPGFHVRTSLRSPWNVDSGSASAPTVAEAGMADEPAVVAGAGITEECVDAVTQARAMLIRHKAAEIVEAAGMRETLTSRQGCHA